MSAHTKMRHTKQHNYIDVRVGIPGSKIISYIIPSSERQKLNSFLKSLEVEKNEIDSWDEAIPWKTLASDRIAKYKKAGLVLRGARYRENMSQVALSKKTKVHQNEISKIENGKRAVGKKVAQRLAKTLNFDYRLLLDP